MIVEFCLHMSLNSNKIETHHACSVTSCLAGMVIHVFYRINEKLAQISTKPNHHSGPEVLYFFLL